MADAVRSLKRVTVEEYFAADEASASKSEFRDGVVYAMGGATDDHGRIAGNLFAAIHGHLPDRCDVFQGDMRLKVRAALEDAYYYPDVMVTCSDLEKSKIYREQPTLVIEVLSPSSERIDRSEKFSAYTQLGSLQEYVIVAQSVPQIDIFRRSDAWRGASYFREDIVTFESIGLSLPVPTVYRRIKFGNVELT